MNQDDPHRARPSHGAEAVRAVRVRAPGRLHVGFLDLGGALGRRFGGLGLTIEEPATRVRLERAEHLVARGPDSERAKAALTATAAALGIDDRVAVTVESALPPHAGLGSGTQLGLAVGVALAELQGVEVSPRAVAEILGRGRRSSIGLGAFETGGVILDGGRGERDAAPPILSRIPIPADWRILLIFDTAISGLSGSRETVAMASLPPFPEELADRLCRLAVLGALPAAAEGDAVAFGRAVGEMQRRLGDHFAKAQGGRFTSRDVADALAAIEARGTPGVGQSSWGPTGFAVFGDAIEAEETAAAMRIAFADRPNLAFAVTHGANHGAEITHETGTAQRAGLALAGDANVRR